jgi:hypothetical protein
MKYPGDAYVAGLIDGEGCIGIARSRKGKRTGERSYRVIMDMGMTIKALSILRALQEEFGGTVVKMRAATDRWEEAHCWSIGGPAAAEMLRRVAPFLQLKQEQANLGIALEEIHQSLPRSEYGQGIRFRWTPEARERCEIIRLRVMELNKKGPQPRSSRPPAGAKPFAWLVAGEWRSIDPDLFSEVGSPLLLKTWPRSGTVLSGVAYELPMPEQLIVARESSSSDTLLPTPRASANENRTTRRTPSQLKGTHGRYLAAEVQELNLLPTPNTLDHMFPKTKEQIQAHRDEGKGGDRNLREAVLYELEEPVKGASRWGKYKASVERWELALGRPAPEPTEPGENGPRLNARFSEWLMGMPEGWVTDVPGVSRENQLRIIGNSCMPQQAELALRTLLTQDIIDRYGPKTKEE